MKQLLGFWRQKEAPPGSTSLSDRWPPCYLHPSSSCCILRLHSWLGSFGPVPSSLVKTWCCAWSHSIHPCWWIDHPKVYADLNWCKKNIWTSHVLERCVFLPSIEFQMMNVEYETLFSDVLWMIMVYNGIMIIMKSICFHTYNGIPSWYKNALPETNSSSHLKAWMVGKFDRFRMEKQPMFKLQPRLQRRPSEDFLEARILEFFRFYLHPFFVGRCCFEEY